MKKSELIKKLEETYKYLKNNEDKYVVTENVEPGRGVNTYKFVFVAKKKKKSGIFGAIVSIAKEAALYGTSGIAYGISEEIARRTIQSQMNLEPINKELLGKEIAAIFARWIETIPEGYIETIGNNLKLPEDDRWIIAKINPKKEIKITIDHVSLWQGKTQETQAPREIPQRAVEAQSPTPTQPTQVAMPVSIPSTILMPNVDFSNLYLKGSLRSTSDEVTFKLINPMGPATIIAPFQVTIDGKVISSEHIIIESSTGARRNTDVTSSNPLRVPVGDQLKFRILGEKLDKGEHDLRITVNSAELSTFVIAVTDTIR